MPLNARRRQELLVFELVDAGAIRGYLFSPWTAAPSTVQTLNTAQKIPTYQRRPRAGLASESAPSRLSLLYSVPRDTPRARAACDTLPS